MKDNGNVVLENSYGLAVGTLVTVAGIAFFARRCFANIKQQLKKQSDLNEAVLNCQIQDENQIADIMIIKDALVQYNQETRFLINKNESVVKYSYFQATLNQRTSIKLLGKENCTELLRECYELMGSYPKASFDEKLTLEAIEFYHAASEAHHEKVLTLAENLLPDLSNLLNETRLKVTHSAETI